MSDIKETSELNNIYDKENCRSRDVSGKIEDIEAVRTFGTEIANWNETGRAALRPQPSADPNDPLVTIFIFSKGHSDR